MSDHDREGDHGRGYEDRSADGTTMAELSELLGVPDVDDTERAAVLDLTRVVAHTVERRFGPVTAYALGLSAGSATDPARRVTALRDAVAVLESRAADGASGEPA